MENKTILLIAGIIVIVAGLITYVNVKISQIPQQIPQQGLGYVGSTNTFVAANDNTDNSSAWISSTTVTTIAANASRQFARISIASGSTSTVWIWQATSTDLVATGKGIPLRNSSSTFATFYQIDANNLYRGAIQLISENNTKVSWIEQP